MVTSCLQLKLAHLSAIQSYTISKPDTRQFFHCPSAPSLPPYSLWPLKSLNVSRSGSTARCGQQQSTQLGGDTQGAAARSTGDTNPELISVECRGVSNQYNSRCCLFIFRKVWTSCQQIVTNLTFFNFQNIMRGTEQCAAWWGQQQIAEWLFWCLIFSDIILWDYE